DENRSIQSLRENKQQQQQQPVSAASSSSSLSSVPGQQREHHKMLRETYVIEVNRSLKTYVLQAIRRAKSWLGETSKLCADHLLFVHSRTESFKSLLDALSQPDALFDECDAILQ